MVGRATWLVAVLLVLAGAGAAAAADPQDTVVAPGNIDYPTAMAIAPDGRIFAAEQGGRLKVIKDGAILTQRFVTLPVTENNERGLLGVALDPGFATNGWVYLYYTTTKSPVVNRLSRFTASAANPDVAEPGSEEVILDDIPSESGWHNGGAIHFGPDGKLYVAVGESHDGANAQDMTTLAGKLLRINPDGSIPADNPFYETASGVHRAIWALGLRNPFTFDIHTSGRIFVNDVGGGAFEEINELPGGPNDGSYPGFNFGWPATEGPTTDPAFKSPFHHYANTGADCAITGGAFYDPPAVNFPAQYVDDYFFADHCGDWIRSIDVATKTVTNFVQGADNLFIVDLEVGDDGSLYYLARGPGNVHRLRFAATATPPSIVTHPQPVTAPSGGDATFSVQATGTQPLSYRWQRDGIDIGGATSSTYTLEDAEVADDGALFRVIVSNDHGSATSDAARLTVSPNRPPAATIGAPEQGATYAAGDTVAYAGGGADPEDGELGGDRFTWRVDFHHADHVHPFVAPASGASSGQFTIPTSGHADADVWYRINLTVRDSEGVTHSTHRDVVPRTAGVTLDTNVPGLGLTLDDQPVAAPHTHTGVVGMGREIAAPSPQTVGGKTYEFVSWSDGGAATHTIATPASDTTYTATFREVPPAIVGDPQDLTVRAGEDATFRVTATGSPPLGYQWQRDGVDIPGATDASYTLPDAQPADDGAQLRAIVTNATGSATSDAATLSVTESQAPTATITTPPAGTRYSAGETIAHAGTGTDPEDGTLDAARFTWRVDFHHSAGVSTFIPATSGSKTGQFTIPAAGHTPADWYRIHLTVRDSAGLTHSTQRDVMPRTAQVTLATNVPGLGLTLDDQPVAAPHSHTGVVGIRREIEAPSAQTVGGKTYEFVSWSDGGAATHTIATPATDTTYTATYREVAGPPPGDGGGPDPGPNPGPGVLPPPGPAPGAGGDPAPLSVLLDAPDRMTWRGAARRGVRVRVTAPAGTLVLVQLRRDRRALASRLVRIGPLGARLVRLFVEPPPARPTRRLRIKAFAIGADAQTDIASRPIVVSRRR